MNRKPLKRAAALALFGLLLLPPAGANEYPDKCRNGNIIKRDLLTSSGESSPLKRRDARYDENHVRVEIQDDRYRYSYKNCWSSGDCAWVDSRWNALGKSNHGAVSSTHGYGAYFGTMQDSSSVYVCWYKD